MEAPKRATKFAANDEWGKVWRNAFGVAKMNQSLSILTGASAGATEAFVVVPFELVKIRLQDRAQAAKYNGMIDCVQKVRLISVMWIAAHECTALSEFLATTPANLRLLRSSVKRAS